MSNVFVQFSDSTKNTIIAAFNCEQDADTYPNQGTIDADASAYIAFIDPAGSIVGARRAQLVLLESAFSAASTAAVTDGSGVVWSGGISSALSIYGAVQLAAAGGATSMTLFDADNLPHVVTIAEGTAVAAVIGAAYQTVFAKYQDDKVAISAATTVVAVQAITWA